MIKIRMGFAVIMIFACLLVGCGDGTNDDTAMAQTQETTKVELKFEDVLIGKWITTTGTADNIARIYQFYKSGIVDNWVGDTSGTPLAGSWLIEGKNFYFNPINRNNPKGVPPMTVESFSENEIVVNIEGKVITWKRYE